MENNNAVTIMAVGDSLVRNKTDGKESPFRYVADIFRNADLRFMNLETVLTDKEKPVAKKWINLKTKPKAVEFIKTFGVDVVNLAHNHIKDYGPKGFNDTLDCLKQANISFVGAGKTENSIIQPVVFNKNGLKVAFVSFFMYDKSESDKEIFIANFNKENETTLFIKRMSKLYDLIIVSLHWGTEHIFYPSPGQIDFAHRLIDNGAHLIIGHHSHCVQGFEQYKNGLIAYSLGNFNFWHSDVETKWFNRLSVILQVKLIKKGVLNWELLPIWIKEDYEPVPILKEEDKKRVMDHYNQISRFIADKIINWNNWYEEVGPIYIPQTLKGFAITIPKYGFGRIKELLRWIVRIHTLKAVAGMIRNFVKNKKPYSYNPSPIIPDIN